MCTAVSFLDAAEGPVTADGRGGCDARGIGSGDGVAHQVPDEWLQRRKEQLPGRLDSVCADAFANWSMRAVSASLV